MQSARKTNIISSTETEQKTNVCPFLELCHLAPAPA